MLVACEYQQYKPHSKSFLVLCTSAGPEVACHEDHFQGTDLVGIWLSMLRDCSSSPVHLTVAAYKTVTASDQQAAKARIARTRSIVSRGMNTAT
jgi:hypothetical protein